MAARAPCPAAAFDGGGAVHENASSYGQDEKPNPHCRLIAPPAAAAPLRAAARRFFQMALIDNPAHVAHILARTGVPTLSYIGHSQGTAIAFAGFSSCDALPAAFCAGVRVAALLAPIPYSIDGAPPPMFDEGALILAERGGHQPLSHGGADGDGDANAPPPAASARAAATAADVVDATIWDVAQVALIPTWKHHTHATSLARARIAIVLAISSTLTQPVSRGRASQLFSPARASRLLSASPPTTALIALHRSGARRRHCTRSARACRKCATR